MRYVAGAFLVALVATVAGCSLDLTKVSGRPSEAWLMLQLEVHDPGGRLDARAQFFPGTAENGRLLRMHDDSLRLAGTAVAPVGTLPDSSRVYRISGLDAPVAPLRIRVPPVVGAPEAPPEITAELIRVVAPDTLVGPRPGVLTFRLAGVDAAGGADEGSWQLTVHAETDGDPVLSLSGTTPPDSVHILPTELLPDGLSRGYINFTATCIRSHSSPAGFYDFVVTRRVRGMLPFRIRG